MSAIIPFSAVYYNKEKVNRIDDLICPPFDVVSDDLKQKLSKNPNNFIHVNVPAGESQDRYKLAANKLFGYLLRDVLILDKNPCLYVHELNYVLDGNNRRRYGLIGLMKLEEYGAGVKKHEKTNDKLVEDRYNLQKESQSNLDPVFCLYQDKNNELIKKMQAILTGKEAVLEFNDLEGCLNKVYRIQDEALIKDIETFFADKNIYIGDGHHRYEAALRYQKDMKQTKADKYTGKEPFNFVLADFFNIYDEAVQIQPIHRVIKKLSKTPSELVKLLDADYKFSAIMFNDSQTEKQARRKIRALLSEYKAKKQTAFALFFQAVPNRYFLMVLKKPAPAGSLDAVLLDSTILQPVLGISGSESNQNVSFEFSDQAALDAVRNGAGECAFLLNPVDKQKMLEASDRNELMPNLTTYFYPKISSGILLYSYRYSSIKI